MQEESKSIQRTESEWQQKQSDWVLQPYEADLPHPKSRCDTMTTIEALKLHAFQMEDAPSRNPAIKTQASGLVDTKASLLTDLGAHPNDPMMTYNDQPSQHIRAVVKSSTNLSQSVMSKVLGKHTKNVSTVGNIYLDENTAGDKQSREPVVQIPGETQLTFLNDESSVDLEDYRKSPEKTKVFKM